MKNKFLLPIFISFLFTTFEQAAAQLYCTNATNEPVWVAVAYNHTPKENGVWQPGRWVTEGWLFILPRDTIKLTAHIGAHANFGLAYEFYYFAYQPIPNGKQWTGTRNFLVDLDPEKEVSHDKIDFHINHSDKLDAYREYPYLVPFKFRYATGIRSGVYTIVLRQQD